MSLDILIATHNPGKAREIAEALVHLGANFVNLKDLGITQVCPEGESDFSENARTKAEFYRDLSGMITVADDSGIWVEALAGELGVTTRRFGAGENASDEEWLDVFMQRMQRAETRAARFVCAAAIAFKVGPSEVFLGEVHGAITETVEAPVHAGIPLSSVFKPVGGDCVFSAMSLDEKRRFSHRGQAFAALEAYLLNHAQALHL